MGSTGATFLPTPWQSVGARGVNNLAAKLLLTLFPPGSAFFKLSIAEAILDKLKQQAGANEDVVGETEEALAKAERAVLKQMESSNLRSVCFEAIKHLIVVGSGLLFVMSDAMYKFFPLSQHVVKRDLKGNPLEIVTKECLSRRTIPPAAREIVERHSSEEQYKDTTKALDLYTWVMCDDNGAWESWQEICGERIPGSESTYPKGKAAWLPLRWSNVPGEDYGRSHVEEYLGDLLSLEALSKSLVDGAAACARIIFLVDEAGVTSKKTLDEAPNCSVRDGTAKDISVVRVDKMPDFAFAKGQADEIKQRLEQAFLLASSVTRQAERVTAEEIRLMAGELEQTLGGVYSMLAQDFQRPLAERTIAVMQKSGKLPQFPDKAISPEIVTGVEGLGRTTDFQKLQLLLTNLGQTFGPEEVAQYVNTGAWVTRAAAALALDIDGLVRSDQEVEAAKQQQQQLALAQSLGPKAIDANAKRDVAATQAQAAPQAAPPTE
jgi:hypothetical protein